MQHCKMSSTKRGAKTLSDRDRAVIDSAISSLAIDGVQFTFEEAEAAWKKLQEAKKKKAK